MQPRAHTTLLLPIATHALRQELLNLLHAAFRAHPDRYAIAFPEWQGRTGTRAYRTLGNQIRLFAQTPERLVWLLESLSARVDLVRQIRVSPPESLPDDYAGPWVEYRRVRPPKIPADVSERARLDLERVRQQIVSCPDFEVVSRQNGHAFRVFIEQRPPLAPAQMATEIHPDSYGLSVKDRAFALPDLS